MSLKTPLFFLQPKGTPLMSGEEVFRAVMSRFEPDEWMRRFTEFGVLPSLFEHARWLIRTGGECLTPTLYISVEASFSLEHGIRSFTIDAMIGMLIAEGWVQPEEIHRWPAIESHLPADWTPDLLPQRTTPAAAATGTLLQALSEEERAKLMALVDAASPKNR